MFQRENSFRCEKSAATLLSPSSFFESRQLVEGIVARVHPRRVSTCVSAEFRRIDTFPGDATGSEVTWENCQRRRRCSCFYSLVKTFFFFLLLLLFPFSFQNRKKKRHGASKGELGAAGNVVIRRRTRRVLLMRARASSHLVAPPPWTFSPCLAVDLLPSYLCLVSRIVAFTNRWIFCRKLNIRKMFLFKKFSLHHNSLLLPLLSLY